MSTKKAKFLIVGAFIFIVCTVFGILVKAAEYSSLEGIAVWGQKDDTIVLNLGSLANPNNKNLYCIQNSGHMTSWHTTTYTVQSHVSIDGNVATASTGKTMEHQYNAQLAYILGGGNYDFGYGPANGSYGPRQLALYVMWEKWNNAVGSSLGVQVDED